MSSRFPILLWWGPELAMIYNDGYAPMHAPRCSACCAASSRSSSSRIVRASRRGARTSRSFGKPLLEALPELVDQPFPELLRQVRRTGEPVRTKSMVARLARTPGGPLEDLHLDFVYEPILCPEGNVDAILVFAVDVTTQVLAKKVVEHALDDAHRANEAKDQFLALLGHELRNPMAPILTALEIMKLRDDRNVGEQREIISRQARHLVRLIDDLLDVSRIARGRVELARERVAIAELVANGIEIASPMFERRQHRLEVDVADGLFVDADRGRIAQVLSNILTNAAKYTPPGGLVLVRAWREGTEAVISVKASMPRSC